VEPSAIYLVNAQATLVILFALLLLPLKPLQVLSLALSIEAFFCLSYHLAVYRDLLASDERVNADFIFLAQMTLLSTAVSVNVYRRIHDTYLSHQKELRASNELREAQHQMLLSDNAASMGRLGAADEIEAELWSTARSSVERIQGIVARIQRFTNLDRAEVLSVDMNSVLKDVADIVREAMERRVEFVFDLQHLPRIEVRPQQLSAVFSALLHYAAKPSGDGGRVRIETRRAGATIEIAVRDGSEGLPDGGAERVLEPEFRVKDGRVAAANWSLFGARQIVRQHGGEIAVHSAPGEGTTVRVTLPC